MKDAKIRAEAITKAVGGKVGSVQSVRSGVFQVTTPDSTMTADGGAYDTSSIEKTVTSTTRLWPLPTNIPSFKAATQTEVSSG